MSENRGAFTLAVRILPDEASCLWLTHVPVVEPCEYGAQGIRYPILKDPRKNEKEQKRSAAA